MIVLCSGLGNECIWETKWNCDIKFSDFYKIDLFVSVGVFSLSLVLWLFHHNTQHSHCVLTKKTFAVCVFLYFLLRHNTNKFDCLTRLVLFSCMFVVHIYMQYFSSFYMFSGFFFSLLVNKIFHVKQRLFLLSIWFIVFVSNQLLNSFWFNFTWKTSSSVSTCENRKLHK